jgi:hypothetical protein
MFFPDIPPPKDVEIRALLDGGNHTMTNQEDISETLAVAFQHIRALHATLSAVMIDIAVLRRFVLKSPKTSRQYHQMLAREVAKSKPLVTTAMRAYEEEIMHIRSNCQWKN